MENNKTVLLTGVTGFLGSHTAIQLLNKGYKVIGTLRSISRAEHIKRVIANHTKNIDKLELVEADLLDSEIWKKLAQGVDYIMHVASPFPREVPKNENDLIVPAKQGTLNILQAALENQIKRVVITSSTAAIVYGKEKSKRSGTFDENDWTNPQNIKDSTPYFRSKTFAEKAVWEFVDKHKNEISVSVVCPGAILGPVLEEDFGTSANIVIKMLDGSTPAVPKIGFDVVDVRSVADLQILAMEKPEGHNQRFIATTGFASMKEIADILRKVYPEKKIPKLTIPDFITRLYAKMDKTIEPVLPDLGSTRQLDNSKAKNVLNWEPIPVEEAILSCAESVLKHVIKK